MSEQELINLAIEHLQPVKLVDIQIDSIKEGIEQYDERVIVDN